ncbi:hypothetical protein DRO55_02355 [Candidatus Bathyarchaeota archaeon]|nr:MAG: hypothetical protein DRO55_02355 [Candidatus Bathyarchaeota archaeon]
MSLERKRKVWAEVEAGLGSSGRIKILKYLIEHPNTQFTRYRLRRPTGLSTEEVSRNIQILVKLGWVKEFPHEPKTYQINLDNEIVRIISDFFKNLRKI